MRYFVQLPLGNSFEIQEIEVSEWTDTPIAELPTLHSVGKDGRRLPVEFSAGRLKDGVMGRVVKDDR